jgi:hypothetical protein
VRQDVVVPYNLPSPNDPGADSRTMDAIVGGIPYGLAPMTLA